MNKAPLQRQPDHDDLEETGRERYASVPAFRIAGTSYDVRV